jgi:hypothetical protein
MNEGVMMLGEMLEEALEEETIFFPCVEAESTIGTGISFLGLIGMDFFASTRLEVLARAMD